MPFDSGTFTIGLPTSDYLTVDAAIADYTGGVVGLSADLTFIIEADTAWTNNFDLYDHNGFTFKITCQDGLYHYGDVNGGVTITVDLAVNVYVAVSTLGTTIIENVIIASSVPAGNLYIQNQSSVGANNAANNIVRNCIFVDTSVWTRQVEATAVRLLFYNNKIINGRLTYDYTYGNYPFSCSTSIIENNSVGHEGGTGTAIISMTGGLGGISDANLILRNNVIWGVAANGFALTNPGTTRPLAYNNAAFNTTATTPSGTTWEPGSSGNLDGISSSEFESLDASSADFMRLNRGTLSADPSVDPSIGSAPLLCSFSGLIDYNYGGNVLPDGGLVPAFPIIDIAEVSYGKYGDYPIGCYNAEVAY